MSSEKWSVKGKSLENIEVYFIKTSLQLYIAI